MSDIQKTYDELIADTKEIALFDAIQNILGWDQETYMPPKGIDLRSREMALLAKVAHERAIHAKRGEWLETLDAGKGSLDPDQKASLRELRRDYDLLTKLPSELVELEVRTTSLAQPEWAKARKESDFSLFAPWLEKIIDIKKKVAECWGYPETPYDAFLDQYEPGATVKSTAAKLEAMREKLVPWVKKITNSPKQPRTDFLSRGYPVDKQDALARFAMGAIGYDTKAGRLDVTTHPFCSGMGDDVRITTRYQEDEPFASLYGVIHETGHALYEQGTNRDHHGAPLGQSSSMSIHESQSLFWENMIGRSKHFLRFIQGHIRESYPAQLADVSFDELYAGINVVRPSFVRVEADDVTYGLHIVVRFEIEKDILAGNLSVSEIPAAWNKKMEQYLGITPPNDAQGCLQDIHWSLGAFGYFPSYALGSMNAAQIFSALRRDIPDVYEQAEQGKFTETLQWLREKIHRQGCRHLPDDLIRDVTGKAPDADDFIAHIAEKFGEIYQVS